MNIIDSCIVLFSRRTQWIFRRKSKYMKSIKNSFYFLKQSH